MIHDDAAALGTSLRFLIHHAAPTCWAIAKAGAGHVTDSHGGKDAICQGPFSACSGFMGFYNIAYMDLCELPVQACANPGKCTFGDTWCFLANLAQTPASIASHIFGSFVPSLTLVVCPQSSCCAFSMAWGDWCCSCAATNLCDCWTSHSALRLDCDRWILPRCSADAWTKDLGTRNTSLAAPSHDRYTKGFTIGTAACRLSPRHCGHLAKFTAWYGTCDNCWCLNGMSSSASLFRRHWNKASVAVEGLG